MSREQIILEWLGARGFAESESDMLVRRAIVVTRDSVYRNDRAVTHFENEYVDELDFYLFREIARQILKDYGFSNSPGSGE